MIRLTAMRSFRFLPCAALSAALALAPAASAKDKKKEDKKAQKAAAEALLAKSRGLSNIEEPGGPPFVLNAKIHYQIGSQSADGQAQIIWLAPDHYREAFSAPNYFYTEIVRDGYRYLARTNNEMPLLSYEVHTALAKAMATGQASQIKIATIHLTQANSDALTCVTAKAPQLLATCVDQSGDVVSTENPTPPFASPLKSRYEFDDFVTFGAKRFPQKILFRGGDGHTIAIDVQKLTPAKEVVADAFSVPPAAVSEPWCAEPKSNGDSMSQMISLTDPELGIEASEPLRSASTAIYVVIGPRGRARAATVMSSVRPVRLKDVQNWMKSMRFPSLRCGKEGIEYQMEIGFFH